MADWSARQYLKFEDERTRPARDLLGHVPLEDAAFMVDLGCGPGNSTEILKERFPKAELLGLDTSADMLSAARARLPDVRFEEGDASTFTLERPADLIYANAVLQWVPDHETLFPRLISLLAPGGVLAVQMPDNLDEPSHASMRAVAADGPWAQKLKAAAGARTALPGIGAYYDLLVKAGAEADIWRTTYNHPLADIAAIVEWVKGTGLRPFVDSLEGAEREGFLSAYAVRLAAHYPVRADGGVLLAFPRLFLVARRRA